MPSPFPYRPYAKLKRWSITIVGVLVVLAAVIALALPPYLKKTLEQQIPAQTGRQFTVQSVSFNPLTLRASLHQVQLMEADGKTPALSADLVSVRVSFLSLLRLAPVLGAVQLEHPNLRLVRRRDNGKEVSNFNDILERFAKHPSGGDPVRFAVYNIELADGTIELDDQISGKNFHIDQLKIGVPFISNFPASQDVYVQPYLSANVDGSHVELKGRSKPFASSLDTNLAFDIDKFNVAELTAFAPGLLPFKLNKATLSTELTLDFDAQSDQHRLRLSGSVELTNVDIADRANAPLLKAKQFKVDLKEVDLINRRVVINAVDLVDPQVWAGFDQQGVLNWASLQAHDSGAVTKGAPKTEDKPFGVELAKLQMKGGVLHWSDAAHATPAMDWTLGDIALDVLHLSTEANGKPGKVTLTAGAKHLLQFDGTVNPGTMLIAGHLALSDLALHEFQPYVSPHIDASLAGNLSVQSQIDAKGADFSFTDLSVKVDDLAIQANNRTYGGLTATQIAVDGVAVDSTQHTVKVGQVKLDQLHGDLLRVADGSISAAHLIRKTAAPAAKASPTAAANAGPAWRAEIDDVALTGSSLNFTDSSVQPAVTIKADPIDIKVGQLTSTLDKPVKLTLRATLNKTGQFAVDGSGNAKSAQFNVNVQNFSMQALQPYFTQFLKIQIAKGSISTTGSLHWSAPTEVAYQGTLNVANLSTFDKVNGDDFVKWKALDVSGIDVDVGGASNNIALGHINLSDFYARAILSEKGRLNLQDITAHTDNDTSQTAMATSSDTKPVPAPAPPLTPAKPATPTTITIGQIDVSNGLVNYTDNFIKPHYSMRLTGMTGRVGTIQSNVAQSAPINLNGKVDDEAPVLISGSLNPLFNPILLDIRMTADGIDLPGLTMYSLKYAGYPIVKGKLSLDVSYHVKDNQLDATNSLKIDQLTFGKQVDGPDSNHLPVPFLVSLLTDSNGQINLDLPISGTINDPQFSIGGLIGHVFLQLMEKVVTSPFTLLAHAFGGGSGDEQFSYIEFEPGSAHLSDASKTKLDNLAKALQQRPALKLDVRGRADMQTDSEGLRRHILSRQIRQSKNMTDEDNDGTVISAADRSRAIEKIYDAATFQKPKNFIGLSKSLPSAEMEKLILANTPVSDDDIRDLALRRESVVTKYLTDTDQIPADRLFSIAPRLNGDGIKDKGSVSRTDFDMHVE